uniref:Retrovirus-related Pol polyprotein from transposon 17.6 n=1 Tax=Cajanus cajan TaxID=3821 RepID=A0A151UD60_CAJCA
MKVEQLFACHKVSEERKVPLATLSFQGHSMYWWTTLERERRLHNDPPIQYWNDLKSAMRRRHIPEPSKSLAIEKDKGKGKVTSHTSSRTSDIKCFKCLGRGHIASQCPTKKVVIIRGHDIYSSQDEATTSSNDSEEETNEQEEGVESTFPYEGELLMIRRLLNNQTSGTLAQRENIFHTRCKVLNNACSLIVDSGSWYNCCSTRLVEMLGLTTSPHPKPYQLHWLNEDGDLVVDQQVKVKLSIGNYDDEVLCDVVPMEACHILLGRPWQYDKKTMHNGLTNEITFTHKEKKFVLHPLSPLQVIEARHLRQVFNILRKNHLLANLEKCTFCVDSVVFLGFIISKKGIHVDPEKIKAIEEWPTPKSVRDIRSFHGLASFYRIFVPNFSTLASPLNELVKKNVDFIWGEKQEKAFITLKDKLTHAPLLALPYFSRNFELECDASGVVMEKVRRSGR